MNENIYIVCNFSDTTRDLYPLGVAQEGEYVEIFNSQSSHYEGWNIGNTAIMSAEVEERCSMPCTLRITLPPLGVIYLQHILGRTKI